MTHYETLGIKPDATQDEVNTAFRAAAQTAHPDRPGGDAETFKRVNAAGRTLRDPEARARYDAGQGDADRPAERTIEMKVAEVLLAAMREVDLPAPPGRRKAQLISFLQSAIEGATKALAEAEEKLALLQSPDNLDLFIFPDDCPDVFEAQRVREVQIAEGERTSAAEWLEVLRLAKEKALGIRLTPKGEERDKAMRQESADRTSGMTDMVSYIRRQQSSFSDGFFNSTGQGFSGG